MAAIALSPDDLVEYIIEEIIVSCFSTAKLAQIWTIVRNRLEMETISEIYQSLIWSWLVKKSEIEVYNGEMLVPWESTFDLTSLIKEVGGEDKIQVNIEESKQWLYLTNKPKEGNPIGIFPFNLLKYIISRRERGISGSELAKLSGQDPRSLTSRLAVLEKEGLIKKSTANIPGITTSLVVHTKFYISFKEALPTFNRLQLMKQVVDVIKNSKNSIRTQRDVAEELGYGGSPLSLKRFRRVTRSLCRLGNLKKVLVAPLENSNRRATTRALMYIKDFQLDVNSEDEDEEDDDEEDDEEEEDDLTKATLDFVLKEGDLKIIEDDKNSSTKIPTLNSHFPLVTQLAESIKKSGSQGIPAMLLNESLVGSGTSWFLRFLTDLKINATPDTLANHSIVRAPDSEGKIKFYRYFNLEEFAKLTGQRLDSAAGNFLNLTIDDDPSLVRLSLEFKKSLTSGAVEIVHCPDGKDRLFWGGITDPLIRAQYLRQLKEVNDIETSTTFIDESSNEVVASLKEKLTAQQQKRLSNQDLTQKTRGRPKKDGKRSITSEESSVVKKHKPIKSEILEVQFVSRPSSGHIDTSTITETMPRSSLPLEAPKIEPVELLVSETPEPLAETRFNIDFKSFRGSIRSNERKQTLIDIIEQNGGLAVTDTLLARQIGKRMNISSVIDKVTLKKDAELLVASGVVNSMEFQERRKDGEEGNTKTLLISVENRPSDAEIENFIATYNGSSFKKPVSIEPEVVSVLMEFKKVNAPKAMLPRKSALDRKLSEVKSKASDAFIASKKRQTKTLETNTSKKSHKKSVPPTEAALEGKDEIDPMLSYLSNIKDLKRKVKSKKRESKKGSQIPREKTKQAYDFEYIISVLKAYTIVTSLLYNKTIVDWAAIIDVLGDPDVTVDQFKRRWIRIRRQLRQMTLPKIREVWENFLNVSVKNGTITYKMLSEFDFKSMYEIWNESDMGNFDDDLTLYSNYLDNFIDNEFVLQHEEKITFAALPSSLEKARYLTNTSFTSAVEAEVLQDGPHDEQQAVLKSIFSTEVKDFNAKKSRQILKSLGDYFPALKDLEVNKEIAYLGENSETKFTLPEKTWSMFQNKIDSTFLEGSSKFLNGLQEVFDAQKGMVLSAMTPDYTIACLLHLLMQQKVKIILVDRVISRKYSGYFTRAFDGLILEADFVITLGANKQIIPQSPNVLVPMGKPCSRVWIDMSGNLKSEMWKLIIPTVINHIYFRPGIDLKGLYELTRSLLLLFELKEVLTWLSEKHAIQHSTEGYFVCENFSVVIG